MVSGEQDQRAAPVLRPPGTVADTSAAAAPAYRWVWAALAMILALGVAVIVLLPRLVSERHPPAPESSAAVPATVGRASPASEESARADAEQTLHAFLQAQARLELVNAGAWGEPDWSQATAAAAAGDRLFGQRSFAEAAASYAHGLQLLEGLESGRAARLAAALDAGREALAADDGDAAQRHFELALLIEPGQQEALQGLAQARARADVLRLVAAGEQAEAANDLQAALSAYGEALQRDGTYAAAVAGQARVAAQIRERQFRDRMNAALAALDAGRLAEADAVLEAAARLFPDDPALGNARQRLVHSRQAARLLELRRAAEASVKSEDWKAAAALYQKALAVEPGAAFAREGLARARDRIQLHSQLDRYLTEPARLYAPEPLANARRVLTAAGEAPAEEVRLAEKIAALTRLVSQASVPLPVTLRSDGETEVVIYHVGRLGRFQEQRMELKPGTYTVVGSRPGYRDVRQVFTLRPDTPVPALVIRCEEPI